MLRLVHDVLDSQLVDREGRPCGRVDGVVLLLTERGAPCIIALEVGGLALARRLHRRLEGWLARQRRWLGPAAPRAYRIPWSAVRRVDAKEIRVDIDAAASPLWSLEGWLVETLVRRLPGGGR